MSDEQDWAVVVREMGRKVSETEERMQRVAEESVRLLKQRDNSHTRSNRIQAFVVEAMIRAKTYDELRAALKKVKEL